MNLHDVMGSLQQASDLDLLRLRTAIDHLLHSPTRILAVRQPYEWVKLQAYEINEPLR